MSTWIKLDDTFCDHPKLVQAGPTAGWLYICGLTYSSRNLTDGFIPAGMVRRLADIDDSGAVAEELVNAGLWHETTGGFLIHDYADHQRTSAEIEDQRASARARQQKHRGSTAKASRSEVCHTDVTRDKSVSHADVTAPETETETEKETPCASAEVTASQLAGGLDDFATDMLASTFASDPSGAFQASLDAAEVLAADHPDVSPSIRSFLRNRVLGRAAKHFHELDDRSIGRLCKEAAVLGDDGHRWLVQALASTASAPIDGNAASYVIATARRTAAQARGVAA